MTQPGQGEDAGQLDVRVLANLRGFAAQLRRDVNAAAAKVRARVQVEARTTGLRTQLRAAVKEASAGARVAATVGVLITATELRRAVREAADKAEAKARIGVSVAATELRRAVAEAAVKAKPKVKVDADTKPAEATIGKLDRNRVRLGIDTKGFLGHVGAVASAAANVAAAAFRRRLSAAVVGNLVKVSAKAVSAVVETTGELVSGLLAKASTAAAGVATSIATSIATAISSGVAMTLVTGGINLLVGAVLALAAAAAIAATAFVSLAPIVLLVGGIWGSLWTILAGLVGLVGVAILSFRGLGTAFKELAEDGKVSAETLRKLAPSAREFVNAIAALKAPFAELSKIVQQRFFAGLGRTIRDLATAWLPTLRTSLGYVAGALNFFTKQLLQAFGQPQVVKNFAAAFEGFADFIARIGFAMPEFVDSWGRLAKGSIPFLRELGDLLGGAIERFNEWIKRAEESGDLNRFMHDAAQALRDIWDIGGLVIGIIGEIIEILFPDSKTVSDSFLGGVKRLLEDIKAWLADPENQKKIQEWIDKIQQFVDKAVTEWIPAVVDFFMTIDSWVSKAKEWGDKFKAFEEQINGVVGAIVNLAARLTGALTNLPTVMFNLGANAGNSFVRGIASMLFQAENIGSAIGKAAAEGAKAALKSRSPSRVFMEIGEQVVQGYTAGMDSRLHDVTRAAQRLGEATTGPFQTPEPRQTQGDAAGGGAGAAAAPLVGEVNLNAADAADVRDQLEELMFQLRRIRQGGVYADG